MIERAKAANTIRPITVFALACGHGDELAFFAEDPDIKIVGLDSSPQSIASAEARYPQSQFIVGDSEDPPSTLKGTAQAAIAVNAMIYKPDHMLRALWETLQAGSECSVNFRLPNTAGNQEFVAFCKSLGTEIKLTQVRFANTDFPVTVFDYSRCPDPQYRALGQQMYLTSAADIDALIQLSGFEIVSSNPFLFTSHKQIKNETVVFRLRKAHLPS